MAAVNLALQDPDIWLNWAAKKNKQVLVGFAAETSDLEKNSLQKVTGKNLDFLVANDITQAGAGFGSDTNIVKFVYPDGAVKQMPLMDKTVLARLILDEALALRRKRE